MFDILGDIVDKYVASMRLPAVRCNLVTENFGTFERFIVRKALLS